METPEHTSAEVRHTSRRKWWATAAVAAGLAVGAAGLVGAVTGSDRAVATAQSPAPMTAPAPSAAGAPAGLAGIDQRPDPSSMPNGPGETLLTGDDAAKATAAAEAAVPGAEVIRVETDSGDASYEAHMQKADGSTVTVLMDHNFSVTGTQNGFGPGGPGPGGPLQQNQGSHTGGTSPGVSASQ